MIARGLAFQQSGRSHPKDERGIVQPAPRPRCLSYIEESRRNRIVPSESASRCSRAASFPNPGVLLRPLAKQPTHLRDDNAFIDAAVEALLDRNLQRLHPGLVFQLGLLERTDRRPHHLAGIVVVAALNALLNVAVEFLGQTHIPGRHGPLLRVRSYAGMATFAIEIGFSHKTNKMTAGEEYVLQLGRKFPTWR